MTKKIDHKSIYGAGYHAGVLSVTNESKGNPMVMTASRMKQLESQQTGIAQKVYEAVPMNEAWTSQQIVAEIARKGSKPDFQVVQGCLNKLTEIGLISEKVRGLFQRVRPKAEPSPQPAKEPQPVVLTDQRWIAAAPEITPIDKLATATSSLRALSKQLTEAASQIDDAVLALEAQHQSQNEEIEKLRQLKSLLQGLNS